MSPGPLLKNLVRSFSMYRYVSLLDSSPVSILTGQAKFPTSQVISVDIEAGRMCRSMNKQNLDAVPLGSSVDQGMEAMR